MARAVIRALGMLIVAVAVALTVCAAMAQPASAGAIRVYHQPPAVITETPLTPAQTDEFCSHFERINDATWRTEAGADLTADDEDAIDDNGEPGVTLQIHIPPSDITDRFASDLFWTIETSCPHEGGQQG